MIPTREFDTLSRRDTSKNPINPLQPMTTYVPAFLAVARHENEPVDYYARDLWAVALAL
jgi:hypothetical protein